MPLHTKTGTFKLFLYGLAVCLDTNTVPQHSNWCFLNSCQGEDLLETQVSVLSCRQRFGGWCWNVCRYLLCLTSDLRLLIGQHSFEVRVISLPVWFGILLTALHWWFLQFREFFLNEEGIHSVYKKISLYMWIRPKWQIRNYIVYQSISRLNVKSSVQQLKLSKHIIKSTREWFKLRRIKDSVKIQTSNWLECCSAGLVNLAPGGLCLSEFNSIPNQTHLTELIKSCVPIWREHNLRRPGP